MSDLVTPRLGGGRRRAAVTGAAGLLGLSTAGAVVAGLDALVKVRPPMPRAAATLTSFGPSAAPGCDLTVTLSGATAGAPGLVGLFSGRGRLLAGAPTRVDGGWQRDVVALPGAEAAFLEVGQPVIAHGDPWAGCEDPFSLGARTVALPIPLGSLTITDVAPPGGSRRAVVYLHGRGGERLTGWWLAPTVLDAGWRAVLPAYRNDPDAGPATGRYLLGGEWVDLVAVLDHLAADGVEEVVLAGWSMGGNIAASYLRQRHQTPDRFDHHPVVRGLVLDAAALDWGVVLRHVAKARRLPHRFVPAVMTYGQMTTRIDWHGLNHLRAPDHLELPVLAFHGEQDDVVPIEVTSTLAAALSDIEVVTVAGAGHCQSVNVDPFGYLGALHAFLDRVGSSANGTRLVSNGRTGCGSGR